MIGPLEIGDKIEVYIKHHGQVYNFESRIVYVLSDTDVAITWDKGWEVQPKMINDGWPPPLEGTNVFVISTNPDHHQSGYGWGRVTRKIENEKVKQVHLKNPGGMICMNCNKMVQYSSANMSDGSFCCRNCRLYKSYMLPEDVTYLGYQGERKKQS